MKFDSMFEKEDSKVRLSAGNRRRSWFFVLFFTTLLCTILLIFRPSDETETSNEEDTKTTTTTEKITTTSDSKLTTDQERVYDNAMAALAKRDYLKARLLGEMLLKQLTIGTQEWNNVATLLTKANTSIMFNKIPCPQNVVYTVQRGDSFSALSDKLNTTMSALWKINGRQKGSSNLQIGEKITCYKGDWRVEILKSHNLLCLYDGNNLFAAYPIGISNTNKIPAGEYTLPGSKRKEYPNGEDRHNTYGTHFLGFNKTNGGIHGTWASGDIRNPFSQGYIRLSNTDAENLSMIVPGGTKVKIVD